jgi:hypothetical protein
MGAKSGQVSPRVESAEESEAAGERDADAKDEPWSRVKIYFLDFMHLLEKCKLLSKAKLR